jgi:hypothetical protein
VVSGAEVVVVTAAEVLVVRDADVVVVAGVEVLVVTDPVSPVFPAGSDVVEATSVPCARPTLCEGGSAGDELETTTPPTMPPTKPAPTSAANPKVRGLFMTRFCV